MHLNLPLSLFLGAVLGASAGEIEVTTGDARHLLHSNKVQLGWDGITITSDFPVSSLRYSDNQFLEGQTPIYENEMVVAVTSDCSEEELGGKPIVSYDFEEERDGVKPYRVRSVQISLRNETTADIDDLSFLDTSVFPATWSYESYWCMWDLHNNNLDDDNSEISKSARKSHDETIMMMKKKNEIPEDMDLNTNGMMSAAATTMGKQRGGLILTAMMVLLGLLMSGAGGTTGDNRRLFWVLAACIAIIGMVHGAALQAQQQLNNNTHANATTGDNATSTNTTSPASMMCKINVEILHDGCRWDPLTVSAPAIRVGDVEISNVKSQKDSERPCTTNYRANLTFPQTTIFHQNNGTGQQQEYVDVPQISGYDQCARMVEGRPFIDQSGTQIQASASSISYNNHDGKNGWCAAASDQQKLAADKDNNTVQQQRNLLGREALGQEWTRRALGEHASVSSFAAFTIALMSNNAPPHLIQDSLTAATDEVRHAKVSFEAASKFLGKPVEPGPLPASSHKFEQDLKALALATAQEGCIDETLSALLAALEVDDLLSSSSSEQQQYITEEERLWLQDQMKTIALEEASHSALAWRTIQWVCEKDALACEDVKSSIFDKEYLLAAVQKRLEGRPFSLEKTKMVWEQIHGALIPLVTEMKAVSASPTTANAEVADLTELVSQKIIEGVVGSQGAMTH